MESCPCLIVEGSVILLSDVIVEVAEEMDGVDWVSAINSDLNLILFTAILLS